MPLILNSVTNVTGKATMPDCSLNKDSNRDQYTRQQSSNHKTKENAGNPFEQLSKIVSNLAEQVKRLQSPSGFDKYGRDNRYKRDFRDNRRDYQDSRRDYKG